MTTVMIIAVGNAPYMIAVLSDDRKAYVTRSADYTVTLLDLTTNTSMCYIAFTGLLSRGIAFVLDGHMAWVVGTGLRCIGVATNTAGLCISLSGAVDAVSISQVRHDRVRYLAWA